MVAENNEDQSFCSISEKCIEFYMSQEDATIEYNQVRNFRQVKTWQSH